MKNEKKRLAIFPPSSTLWFIPAPSRKGFYTDPIDTFPALSHFYSPSPSSRANPTPPLPLPFFPRTRGSPYENKEASVTYPQALPRYLRDETTTTQKKILLPPDTALLLFSPSITFQAFRKTLWHSVQRNIFHFFPILLELTTIKKTH
jgi:hypothetical protein